MTQGVLDLGAAEYHDDQVGDQPTLSASIATILCTRSPFHAWAAHPKLNPAFERKVEERFDIGNCAHALLLQGVTVAKVIEASDWRTASAREERDEARAAGRVPLLRHQFAEVEAMVTAAWTQLDYHRAKPQLFFEGEPEQTIAWEDGGVACRARLDWLRHDRTAVDDYKTTSRSANPEAYARNLFSVGGDIQAAFYLRGCRALGWDPEFRWVVQETSPPYALSVIAPSPGMLEIGMAKVEYALTKWRECLESGEWPGYPRVVAYAELPAWEEARWLEKEARESD